MGTVNSGVKKMNNLLGYLLELVDGLWFAICIAWASMFYGAAFYNGNMVVAEGGD